MKVIPLYRWKRADGGTSVSPREPECDYEIAPPRLVADEGKILKCGDVLTLSVDSKEGEQWEEIDDTREVEE